MTLKVAEVAFRQGFQGVAAPTVDLVGELDLRTLVLVGKRVYCVVFPSQLRQVSKRGMANLLSFSRELRRRLGSQQDFW